MKKKAKYWKAVIGKLFYFIEKQLISTIRREKLRSYKVLDETEFDNRTKNVNKANEIGLLFMVFIL